MSGLHVRVETRRVYVSARGVKLTKHAAYIAAAKKLIADRCAMWNAQRAEAVTATDHGGAEIVSEAFQGCDRGSAYKCRFHAQHTEPEDVTGMGHWQDVPLGMVHYRETLTRLVRFLKFVDTRASGRP